MTTWRKSTRCGTSSCVEVAVTGDAVMMRDSKDTSIPPVHFTKEEWRDFLEWIGRRG